MTNEEAIKVLGDVSAYLASRASLENERLAGHTFTDICKAIKVLRKESCKDKIKVLDKIRAEIDKQEKWLLHAGYTAYNVDIAFDAIKSVVAESEV